MARMVCSRILSSSPTCLSCPSICGRVPPLAPKPVRVSVKSVRFARYRGQTLVVSASSAAVAAASVVPDDIGDVLGEIQIFTAAGDPVRFKDLWAQEPQGVAVVALLRHFGCVCSWELATALREAKEKFDSAGVKLIAVGVGTPDKAQLLAQRLPFPLDSLYADPDRKAYDTLGLYYGIGRTFFNPASVKVFSRGEAFKKALKNYTIDATPQDRSSVLQQGGMFVFKGNKLIYARKDEGTGDHAPLDDVLEICRNAAVA